MQKNKMSRPPSQGSGPAARVLTYKEKMDSRLRGNDNRKVGDDNRKRQIDWFARVWWALAVVLLICAVIKGYAEGGTAPSAPERPETMASVIATDSTDVTTKLRAAIARAATNAGTVIVDSGVILLTDSVAIPANVTVRGNGTQAVFVNNTTGFRVYGKMEGFTVTWSGSNSGAETFGAAISIGSRTTGLEVANAVVDNCTAKTYRQGGAAICVAGKANATIRNSIVESVADSTRFGILVKYSSDSNDSTYHPIVNIENCEIDTMTPADTNGYAISLDGAYQAVVRNCNTSYSYLGCDVRPDSFGFTYAHSANGFGPSSYPSIEVVNCHFRDVWTWGARVSGSVEKAASPDTVTLPVLFTNCTFSGHDTTAASGYSGQDPTGAMIRFWARGVKFSHCSFYGFTKGLSMDEADGVVFEDCIFEGNQYGGFVASSSYPDNIEIRRCKIRNNSAAGGEGIYIGRSRHVTLEGNTIGADGDTTILYGIHIADNSGISQVKMLGNHVVSLKNNANAQAYRVDSIANIYAWANNTIDTSNVPVGRYSKNTNVSGDWKRLSFLGFPLPDSSGTAADGYLLAIDISGSDTSWTFTSPSAGSTDSGLTVQYAHVTDTASAIRTLLSGYLSLTGGGTVTGATEFSGLSNNFTSIATFDSLRINSSSISSDHAGFIWFHLYGGATYPQYFGWNSTQGWWEFGGSTVGPIIAPIGAGGGITVNGERFTDLTGTGLAFSGNTLTASLGTSIVTGEITDGTILEADLNATNSPTDNYLLSYDLASTGFTWVASPAGGSGFWDTLSTADTMVWVTGTDTTYYANFTDSLKIWHSSGNLILGNGDGLFTADSGDFLVLCRADSGSFTHFTLNGVPLDADTSILSEGEAAAGYQPLEGTLTDIADGTIAENLVNTANPWADNEIASSAKWNAGDTVRTGYGLKNFNSAQDTLIAPGDTIVVDTTLLATHGYVDDAIANAVDTQTISFSISAIDDTWDWPFRMMKNAVTIIKVSGVCVGGTNVVGCLMEYDGDAANPAVVNSSDWTFTTGEEEVTSFSNGSIDAGDYLGWKTTSVSGSVTFFTITVDYTVN